MSRDALLTPEDRAQLLAPCRSLCGKGYVFTSSEAACSCGQSKQRALIAAAIRDAELARDEVWTKALAEAVRVGRA